MKISAIPESGRKDSVVYLNTRHGKVGCEYAPPGSRRTPERQNHRDKVRAVSAPLRAHRPIDRPEVRRYARVGMGVDQIAAEALRLPEKERAGLASRLLRCLPAVAFDEDEGVAEALRRDAELDADPTQTMSLRDMDSHIQQRRKS